MEDGEEEEKEEEEEFERGRGEEYAQTLPESIYLSIYLSNLKLPHKLKKCFFLVELFKNSMGGCVGLMLVIYSSRQICHTQPRLLSN